MPVDVLCLFTDLICVQKQISRTPLANVDPNARRRLRSGSTTTEAAPARPVNQGGDSTRGGQGSKTAEGGCGV